MAKLGGKELEKRTGDVMAKFDQLTDEPREHLLCTAVVLENRIRERNELAMRVRSTCYAAKIELRTTTTAPARTFEMANNAQLGLEQLPAIRPITTSMRLNIHVLEAARGRRARNL